MQPVTAYSTMALFTAAWFKLHLEDTPFDMGIDWDNLIFGNTSDSLCGGGDGAMRICEITRGESQRGSSRRGR